MPCIGETGPERSWNVKRYIVPDAAVGKGEFAQGEFVHPRQRNGLTIATPAAS